MSGLKYFIEPISREGAEALVAALDGDMNLALAAAQSIEMIIDRSTAQLSVFEQSLPKLRERFKVWPNLVQTTRVIEARVKENRERK